MKIKITEFIEKTYKPLLKLFKELEKLGIKRQEYSIKNPYDKKRS